MAKWDELLLVQDGVITRAQALRAGMSREQWAWKLERKRWRTLWEGVALEHMGDPTPRQLAWAAQLHGGAGALVSGDAALALRGLRLEVSTIDVMVAPQRRVVDTETAKGFARSAAVVVHRSQVPDRQRFRLQDLPVTDAHLATLRAAAWAKVDQIAERRLAAAVQRRLTAPKLLRATLLDLPCLPRRALIRSVLDDIELGAHAGSELQFFCREHGCRFPIRCSSSSGTAGRPTSSTRDTTASGPASRSTARTTRRSISGSRTRCGASGLRSPSLVSGSSA